VLLTTKGFRDVIAVIGDGAVGSITSSSMSPRGHASTPVDAIVEKLDKLRLKPPADRLAESEYKDDEDVDELSASSESRLVFDVEL